MKNPPCVICGKESNSHAPDVVTDHAYHNGGLITTERLVAEARDLRSESGENPEYDRALVELVAFATGRGSDEYRDIVQAEVLS